MEAHNGSTAPQSQQRLLPVIDRSISARLRQQQTTINTVNDTQTAAASAHQTSVYLVTDHSNQSGSAISPCVRLFVCPNNNFQIKRPLTYIFGCDTFLVVVEFFVLTWSVQPQARTFYCSNFVNSAECST